jgi:hypothetical protein
VSYGALTDFVPLSANPVGLVSEAESQAYKRYVTAYSRLWRQFFDPIAIRIDDAEDGSLEATTFILPLIDSTIYNRLRGFLNTHETGIPLKIPAVADGAVLAVGLNLTEEAWVTIASSLGRKLVGFTGLDSAALDDLDPSVHLAVHDSDPIIAVGSGDILGAFGESVTRFGSGGSMMLTPMALAILTRPCTLAVETRDPAGTLRYLRNLSRSGGEHPLFREDSERYLHVDLLRVGGSDSWMYSVDVMGLLKMRFGVEVKDGFVIVRNIPWSNAGHVSGSDTAEVGGARIAVDSRACDLVLPSLHASAAEARGDAALAGAGLIYPLLASGYATIDEAAEAHMKLFGFRPVHPSGGRWTWDGRDVTSTSYGSISAREQPVYEPGTTAFGLLKDIEDLVVEMQLEDNGLRTTARWRMR